MTFYEFAGNNPVLTVILTYIVGSTIADVFRSFRKEENKKKVKPTVV